MQNSPLPIDFSVLRTLRKRDGLTLAEVAEQSGVSAAVISRLERNLTRAELDTLFRLARVFGLTASDLLSLAESRTAQRTDDERYRSGDFRFRKISFGNVELYHGHARSGGQVKRPEVHGNDHEVCWVLKGTVRIDLPGERHTLQRGEALQFDAVLEHSYEAMADSEIMVLHLAKDKRF